MMPEHRRSTICADLRDARAAERAGAARLCGGGDGRARQREAGVMAGDHCLAQSPVIGFTLTTRNSGIAGGATDALAAVPAADAPLAGGTTAPTICTRRPTHDVMSAPLKRYPVMLDVELPAGAVPLIVPLVPTAPAVGDGAGAAAPAGLAPVVGTG
jgi:hypothetical protein